MISFDPFGGGKKKKKGKKTRVVKYIFCYFFIIFYENSKSDFVNKPSLNRYNRGLCQSDHLTGTKPSYHPIVSISEILFYFKKKRSTI